MLQHKGCDPDSKYNHSRNFTVPILNFFCFNNGYKTQHRATLVTPFAARAILREMEYGRLDTQP